MTLLQSLHQDVLNCLSDIGNMCKVYKISIKDMMQIYHAIDDMNNAVCMEKSVRQQLESEKGKKQEEPERELVGVMSDTREGNI